jgi:hypothetical protein
VVARSETRPYRYLDRELLVEECEPSLRAEVERRLLQELDRLGGAAAHITDEQIDAKHSDAGGTFWLEGTYTWVLFRAPPAEIGRGLR